MENLEGKIAWVTGAGSGIGLASAQSLARAGATVILSGRRSDVLEAAVTDLRKEGRQAEAIALDVCDRDAVARCGATIETRHGGVDILVNSAGMNIPQRSWRNVSPSGFDEVIQVNLNGTYHAIAAVLPGMRARKNGVVINISSWAGRFVSQLTGPAYSGAKHAVVALTYSLNMEECANNIRACAICPGEVATPIMLKRPVPPSPKELAKMLQAEDVARAVMFVATMPAHACVNEIVISPTWNRSYLGGPDLKQPL